MIDIPSFLASADLVIINGGFSAVSEAFMMRKPIVVIPVPNHAEQWINGQTIQNLGVGITSNEKDLEQSMFHALERINKYNDAYKKLPILENGAISAANKILQFVNLLN